LFVFDVGLSFAYREVEALAENGIGGRPRSVVLEIGYYFIQVI
jgi:hypothetical protein